MPEFRSIPEDNRILFFKRDRMDFGFLSHFFPSPFSIDDVDWPTVEHFYQSHKSLDRRYYLAIRAAATPGMAKRLAATPAPDRRDRGSWFAEHAQMPRPDWGQVKFDIMRRADLAKYTQNPDLMALLLATGDAEIVEDTSSDACWGVGPDGKGQNWAGRILMEVRESLRAARTAATIFKRP